MNKWNSSPHPISDIRDWSKSGRFELQPDFQRREVWSKAARIMLIDTILRDIPMPKILLYNEIKEEHTLRTVIDGQQRMSAILAFLRNEFCLEAPYKGDYEGYLFKDLPEPIKKDIFSYSIDFNEVSNISEQEIREVFTRFNKYTIALNKQELRRADFPGKFLDLAESLSVNKYLDTARIFTIANRKRFGDMEFVSELLAGLIAGAQDKKQTLDYFYQKYASWNEEGLNSIKTRFLAILSDINKLFNIEETRFRQKADFYSLFLAIDSLHQEGYSLKNKNLSYLREDLETLNRCIEPHSSTRAFREYAARCLSDANSKSSRLWRQSFIKRILAGTYTGIPPDLTEGEYSFASILFDWSVGDLMCSPPVNTCAICENDLEYKSEEVLIWFPNTTEFQLSNACMIHAKCYMEDSSYFIENLIDKNQHDLFNKTNKVE